MSGGLLTVVVAYLLLVAILGLLTAAGVPSQPAFRAGLVIAEALLLTQLLIDLATLANGHHTNETATHLGYATVSVLLIPLLALRAGQDRTGQLIATIVLAATTIVTVRMHATWATR